MSKKNKKNQPLPTQPEDDELFQSKDPKRADDGNWVKRALGNKYTSNRYGNKLYRPEMEAGNSLKFFPKEPPANPSL